MSVAQNQTYNLKAKKKKLVIKLRYSTYYTTFISQIRVIIIIIFFQQMSSCTEF